MCACVYACCAYGYSADTLWGLLSFLCRKKRKKLCTLTVTLQRELVSEMGASSIVIWYVQVINVLCIHVQWLLVKACYKRGYGQQGSVYWGVGGKASPQKLSSFPPNFFPNCNTKQWHRVSSCL